ncbi:MAG TPA: FAD-dependent oxidoreductase [Methanothrix sp.]|uniref:NAD(P)/FAD-dependent oxidoreductase n=1 Tax=Methanothrix sp. TaxID=90426 RepID=UPI002B844661|nr:FAD-dependent oxidoreductase [Methanothrix sp.]MDI9417775.1 FAD-dependent oxidoreductase [Euryarchaeota archaeon]HON36861.1 FAD-dependent oxidoreductase [Methanothrix sp.]HRU76453.1 FAD-dependent oxidoreductase [Methanothrix sp.]
MVIVGAGPAGLTAAMYCARGGKKTLVLGSIYGSQTAMGGLYENYPGFPDGIHGIELSERILAQAQRFGVENQVEQVEKIVNLGDFFRLKTENWQYEARAIILAMGASHRQIGVPGEAELTARGVSYCVHCDGALFRNKNVAVIGYGNGAARAILYLANIASKVHLLSPKERLVAEPIYLERLKSLTNFAATFGARITEIQGKEFVEGVQFDVGKTPRSLRVDGVFVEMGMKPNIELAEGLGLDITTGGYIKVKRLNQETSMPGVFAAGDLTGGRMQAATAVGEGASAGISALQYLG